MTTQIKRRRGTAAEHASFTGADAELTVNTTNKSVHVHDGTTVGGHELARADGSNLAVSGNDVTFGDDDKAIFGAGSDLEIYHGSNDSFIKDVGQGALRLQGAAAVIIEDVASGDDMARFTSGSDAKLYYNGSAKLATTSTGIDVTGTVTADGLTVDGSITAQAPTATDGLITVKGASGDYSGGIALVADAGENATDWFRIASIQSGGSHDLRVSMSSDTTPTWDTHFLNINSGGDISFYEDTGTTPKFFWDASAESLGIGTSSPSSTLSVTTADSKIATFNGTNAGGAYLAFARSGSDKGYIGSSAQLVSGGSNDDFTVRATNNLTFAIGATEAMRIDSSGTVQIGPSSSDGSRELRFDTGSASPVGDDSIINSYRSNADLIIKTGDVERMRIDSSGNLLVGTTTSPDTVVGASGAGMAYEANGFLGIARAGASLILNRRTTDGDIAVFRKDGTTVGSIGANSSKLYIGAGSANIRFRDDLSAILPTDADGSNSDADLDLGYSSVRWRDLYLSGGVYLGGTGSANKLDDYEEGTWTPVLGGATSTSGQSYTTQTGHYTKIGNTVVAHCEIALTNKGTITGNLRITGLPLNPFGSSGGQAGSVLFGKISRFSSISDQFWGFALNNTDTVVLRYGGFNGTNVDATTSNVNNDTQFIATIIYETDA